MPQRIKRSRTLPSRLTRPTSFTYARYIDDFSTYHQDYEEIHPDHDHYLAAQRPANFLVASDLESLKEESDNGEEAIPKPNARGGKPNGRGLGYRHSVLERSGTLRSRKDTNLIAWELDDPANPKNWTSGRKWAVTIIVSMFTFISPVSSSMVAPALGDIGRELHIESEIEEALVLSIFLLAYAIGPLLFGPLSEVYGRVIVLQLANLIYFVSNLICGFAQTKGQLLAFRFLSGIGGSAPLAIIGGVLADLFVPEERGRAVSLSALGPLLGPAIGPIAGAFITENTTWRWAFWATSIADGLILFVSLFFFQESYPPVLLKRKADRLRKETGNTALHTEFETPDRTISKVLSTAFIRPFRLIGTQPIIQILAAYMAFVYGLIYLILSSFPRVWAEVYHESIGIGGLNYISLGIGFFLGTQVCANVNDRIYQRLKKRNNGVGRPEFRIPLMIPGSILVPIGLFWYGWSAEAQIFWLMPNIGTGIFAFGSIICFQGIQTYILDSYSRYAASAMGAATVLRSLAGFGFPLFAPYMYRTLGNGMGNSLLALISLEIGIPAPLLLWRFGQRLRERSKFASGA